MRARDIRARANAPDTSSSREQTGEHTMHAHAAVAVAPLRLRSRLHYRVLAPGTPAAMRPPAARTSSE